ncbi:hypothetical protein ACN27F_23360 [Solwaraspora sp. WMMB335]|uniref:hypothetical protein n=1 Tax=Solwaraspora sp. WMMB335 TaxID=3404118 RepID=UPI003B92A416
MQIGIPLRQLATRLSGTARRNPGRAAGAAGAAATAAGSLWAPDIVEEIMAFLFEWTVGELYPAVFSAMERYTRPDLNLVQESMGGIAGYIGALLVGVLSLIQIGRIVWYGGRGFARLLIGIMQYAVASVGMIVLVTALFDATYALAHWIIEAGLEVDGWEGLGEQSFDQRIVDGVGGMTLGIIALIALIPSGFVLGIEGLALNSAATIAAATIPIVVAGFVNDKTLHWPYFTLKLFLAAAAGHPAAAFAIVIGIRVSQARVVEGAAGTDAAVAQLLGTGVLMIIACAAPFACFKMFAFIDPNSMSGAVARSVPSRLRMPGWGGTHDTAGSSEGGAEHSTHRRFGGTLAAAGGHSRRSRLGKAWAGTGRIANAAIRAGHNAHSFATAAGALGSAMLDVDGVGHKDPNLGDERSPTMPWARGSRRSASPEPHPDDDPSGGPNGSDPGDDDAGRADPPPPPLLPPPPLPPPPLPPLPPPPPPPPPPDQTFELPEEHRKRARRARERDVRDFLDHPNNAHFRAELNNRPLDEWNDSQLHAVNQHLYGQNYRDPTYSSDEQ